MEKRALINGYVMLDGVMIVLTQPAYARNYGTDGGVRYFAAGEDPNGEQYMVEWDTCLAWDEAGRQYKDSDYEDMPSILDDESNACDWDNPVEIRKL